MSSWIDIAQLELTGAARGLIEELLTDEQRKTIAALTGAIVEQPEPRFP